MSERLSMQDVPGVRHLADAREMSHMLLDVFFTIFGDGEVRGR